MVRNRNIFIVMIIDDFQLFSGEVMRERERHLLGAQREGGAGDGRGEVETFCDLPPDLLVDDLHQASLLRHQLVQLVQVQHLLGHDGNAVDRSPCMSGKEKQTEHILLSFNSTPEKKKKNWHHLRV